MAVGGKSNPLHFPSPFRRGRVRVGVDKIKTHWSVPPPIKWTLSTNDKEGVYDGERENEKGESVQ